MRRKWALIMAIIAMVGCSPIHRAADEALTSRSHTVEGTEWDYYPPHGTAVTPIIGISDLTQVNDADESPFIMIGCDNIDPVVRFEGTAPILPNRSGSHYGDLTLQGNSGRPFVVRASLRTLGTSTSTLDQAVIVIKHLLDTPTINISYASSQGRKMATFHVAGLDRALAELRPNCSGLTLLPLLLKELYKEDAAQR
jgi:hypothetical protein